LRFPQDPHHLFLAESALFHFVLPLLSGQNYIFKTSLRLGSGHSDEGICATLLKHIPPKS
jgi:hypothetical protein